MYVLLMIYSHFSIISYIYPVYYILKHKKHNKILLSIITV
jgi:hypothetical protein